MKFEVKKTSDGRYRVTGVKGYTLIWDNKYDALKHAEYGKTTMIPLTEKHEYITYMEIYDKIEEMKTRVKDKGEATTTFKREDYPELFSILGSDQLLLDDRSVHVKVNLQGGLVTLYLRRKKP